MNAFAGVEAPFVPKPATSIVEPEAPAWHSGFWTFSRTAIASDKLSTCQSKREFQKTSGPVDSSGLAEEKGLMFASHYGFNLLMRQRQGSGKWCAEQTIK